MSLHKVFSNLFFWVLLLSASDTLAQQLSAKTQIKENRVSTEEQLRVIHLRYANAEAVVDIMTAMLGNDLSQIRLSHDPRTNSILVKCPELLAKKVLELAEQLDQKDPDANPEVEHLVQSMPPTFLSKNERLLSSLAGQCNLEISIVPEIGTLILKGDKKQIATFKDLLASVENVTQQHSDASESYMIRFVMLATTSQSQPNAAQPNAVQINDKMFDDVIQRLSKLGMNNVHVVDQFLTRCTVGKRSSRFQAEGQVAMNSQQYQLSIEGNLTKSSENRSNIDSSLRINVTTVQHAKQTLAANVGLDVQLVPNRLLVLASTPIRDESQDGSNSPSRDTRQSSQLIFLVQLIRED